jgi:hypothetical protein
LAGRHGVEPDEDVTGVTLSTGPLLLEEEARALGTTMASLEARAWASATVPSH